MNRHSNTVLAWWIAVAGMIVTSAAAARADETYPAHYVPPISNPLFNETPEIRTEIRPFYIFNRIPNGFPSDGGYINVVGLQLRYAVTERIGVFINKNGYVDVHFSELFPDASGPANVSFGGKYAFIAQPDGNTYLTAGLSYEAAVGDVSSGVIDLQGGGKGFFRPFLSWGATVGERTGIETNAGFNLAVNRDHDTSSFVYSFHVDHEVFDDWFVVLEGNLMTTIDQADRTNSAAIGTFEGYDLFNFGSTQSGTVADLAVGARYRLTDHILFGAAFQFPVTGRKDILGERLTLDMSYHF